MLNDRCQELVERANDMEEKNFVISRVAHRRSLESNEASGTFFTTHDKHMRRSLDGHAPCTLITSAHPLSHSLRQIDIAYCEVWANKVCSTGSLLTTHREVSKLEMAMQRQNSFGHMYGGSTGKEPVQLAKSGFGIHYCR